MGHSPPLANGALVPFGPPKWTSFKPPLTSYALHLDSIDPSLIPGWVTAGLWKYLRFPRRGREAPLACLSGPQVPRSCWSALNYAKAGSGTFPGCRLYVQMTVQKEPGPRMRLFGTPGPYCRRAMAPASYAKRSVVKRPDWRLMPLFELGTGNPKTGHLNTGFQPLDPLIH